MITDYDLMLLGFTLIGVALVFSNHKILQSNLITRDELFDSINDGIIIINNQDKILDLNPCCGRIDRDSNQPSLWKFCRNHIDQLE